MNNGTVFYIGRTKNIHKRYLQHCSDNCCLDASKIKRLKEELEDAEKSLAGIGYVRKKTYERLLKKKVEYEKLYWELWQKVNAPQLLNTV